MTGPGSTLLTCTPSSMPRAYIIEWEDIRFENNSLNPASQRCISAASSRPGYARYEAGAPQGSFINHFGSKEAFAIAVLDRYVERTEAIIAVTLGDETRTAMDRMTAYFDVITDALGGAGWRHGCMISNMSLEAAEHSELIRGRLEQIFASLTQHFSAGIRAAQASGSVRADLDPDELADVLLSSWHGAMLRMKVEGSPKAIDRFKRVVLSTLLTPQASPTLY
ncbi:TetR family transcriptional regulator C-terminal domain-containing protein [Rhizobium beringeri]|uniref:TetR family transcriptional regulator C-terminal domain-containing protein n=1 Tax=Rhizobium beringeri TaxID=3019934 RepID=UPI002E0DAF1E|nr:TetR family transcriptional regulator C-terminal domain-containing protein [Rhizobium beringeri]WSH83315.1 TetR family transcriptional regulator C-terminal domain-containing protein [Rhizobium beringeri]